MKNIFITIISTFFSFSTFSQCYNLVWEDEFNGSSLDNTKWTYQTGGGGWGNNELQYYTDRVDNAYVSGGSLKIEAKSEAYMGANYTSARIRSIGKGDWTYGKMEASIKLPVGQGIWPAFWMMPSESVYGTWPRSGEIDIMEYLGHQPSIVHGTCHFGNAWNDKGSSGNSNNNSPGNYNDGTFHTFTVEWEPTQIRWYVDGLQFHTFNAGDEGAYIFPFDQDFHFILNLAVGGDWPGAPDGTTVFPQILEIDYVRVYQELDDIKIRGDLTVEPTASGVIYSVPDITSTTYSWTVPTGSTITAGAGTHEITVDMGSASGNIEVTMTNTCGNATSNIAVTVSPNLAPNPGFELDFADWNSDVFAGAANFSINTVDVHSGSKSMCANVTSIGGNAWEIQISPIHQDIVMGENYTMSFWAKADANNKLMSIALINSVDFTYYTGKTFTLTDNWAMYSHTYTSTVNANASVNLQFGHETGTFCLDDYLFARTVLLLPIELLSFNGEMRNEEVLLHWVTASENNFSHFEVERSENGVDFEYIGKEKGLDNVLGAEYKFKDNSPKAINYYRLKSMDLDGSFSYSTIININKRKNNPFKIYPTLSSDFIYLDGMGKGELFSIHNYSGSIMTEFNHDSEGILKLNISEFPKGIYFIKTKSGHLKFIRN